MSTVQSGPRRRVVRRARPTLDVAWDTALSELPPEIRPMVRRYAENMRDGQEIRSALSSQMTRHGLKWWTVDNIARDLAFSD